MSIKLFVVSAALCAILLVQQTACEDIEAAMPDELYIINPDSIFPTIVTDPNSPLLDTENQQVVIVCNVQRCQQRCRERGFRFGRCNTQAICVCSNN